MVNKKKVSSMETKKEIILILQAKGGVGKSMLTWLIANNEKNNDDVLFIDLDESTKTSATRLPSIIGESRVKAIKILDNNKKLEREKIISVFESLAESKFKKIIIDFGAPESEEFKRLLEYDISSYELVSELEEKNLKLKIFVVIAGNDAEYSCLSYLKGLNKVIDGNIEIFCLMNEGTFASKEVLMIGENGLKSINNISNVYIFGNIGYTQSGKDIIDMITNQSKISDLNLMAKIRFKGVLKEVSEII